MPQDDHRPLHRWKLVEGPLDVFALVEDIRGLPVRCMFKYVGVCKHFSLSPPTRLAPQPSATTITALEDSEIVLVDAA